MTPISRAARQDAMLMVRCECRLLELGTGSTCRQIWRIRQMQTARKWTRLTWP